MIQLSDVKKTYKSKKGKNTQALDGVTLSLEEKGMTFILGKSGSGKSTLLNLLGGLDSYDDGNITIYGKSSKNFKQADFDSYRNTYIGFIFQEFNLLEDYDVYQNIVLALQLQQKEVNEKEIDDLLEKLELKDLKKRRVNELSGGQKQRVAIARSLIKDPKIILADEPTGNLDSKTGKQVMELLKEISKDKLVLIVSHDEDYAETYGDRIIEISDGKVIKDTKEVKPKEEDNNYRIIKSKLPFKESFKLGSGSLKHKKVKLFFTILLTIITLGFLSCSDTLSNYNYGTEHAKILTENNEQFIEMKNSKMLKEYGSYFRQYLSLDKESEDKIRNSISKTGYDVYDYPRYSNIEELLHIQNKSNNYDYMNTSIVVGDPSFLKEKLEGRLPNDDEIVISNYLADKIINNGIEVYEKTEQSEFKVSNIFQPKNYEEIMNTNYTYYFGSKGKIKISGIIIYDYKGKNDKYKNNVLNKIYVSKNFILTVNAEKVEGLKDYLKAETKIENVEISEWNQTSGLSKSIEYYDGKDWKKVSSLEKGEVLLSSRVITENSTYDQDLNEYINRKMQQDWNANYDSLEKKFFENYIKDKNIIGNKAKLEIYYSNYGSKLESALSLKDLKVIGIYLDKDYSSTNYFSDEILAPYEYQTFEKTGILYPMSEKNDFKNLLKKYPYESEIYVKSTYSEILESEKETFNVLKKLSFYASLIFLVFTIILISNFMFTSISYRKKEIGTLRALGARNTDVAKIFLWEAITMSFISGIIASILLVIVTNIMNNYIMNLIHIITTPFVVGIRQFVVIYLLVFTITIVSSLLPIHKISKMKPIDAILNK